MWNDQRRFCGRNILLLITLTVLISTASCEDNTINCPAETNDPPSIVWIHPEYPDGVVILVGSYLQAFTVLVADNEGLNDIFGVFMDVGSFELNGVTCRADTTGSNPNSCSISPSYHPGDIVDIMSEVPTIYPGLIDIKLRSSQDDGVFRSNYWYPAGDYWSGGPVLIDLVNASPIFEEVYECEYLEEFYRFRLNPPFVPEPVLVFVTLVDMTFRDMTVTVYDGGGHRVTKSIPDLRVIFMTGDEADALP